MTVSIEFDMAVDVVDEMTQAVVGWGRGHMALAHESWRRATAWQPSL
jgi:hypothetical protein